MYSKGEYSAIHAVECDKAIEIKLKKNEERRERNKLRGIDSKVEADRIIDSLEMKP